MATHNEIGKRGELLAAGWLKNKGFTLQERNWRYSRFEMDIIAVKEGVLHFVEVKTSAGLQFGFPEERVTARKFQHLRHAATAYLMLHPNWNRIQYDILSVVLGKGGVAEFFFLEDCY